jgi:hypothetical protein
MKSSVKLPQHYFNFADINSNYTNLHSNKNSRTSLPGCLLLRVTMIISYFTSNIFLTSMKFFVGSIVFVASSL